MKTIVAALQRILTKVKLKNISIREFQVGPFKPRRNNLSRNCHLYQAQIWWKTFEKSTFDMGMWRKLGFAVISAVMLDWSVKKTAVCQTHAEPDSIRSNRKVYRLSEVEKHKTVETGIWVIYREGVYDITEYIEGHPGGDEILEAAGQRVEPFWEVYTFHFEPDIQEMLETLHIGNLHPDDVANFQENASKESEKMESGTGSKKKEQLIPRVDIDKFRLTVGSLKLSMSDLRSNFSCQTVIASTKCPGGKKKFEELHKKPAPDAEWTGVLLSDLLKRAGIKSDEYTQCILEGLDTDKEGRPYRTAIPMDLAVDESKNVMVVFQMNGKELPLEQGFPLRVIVPGKGSARQVKWVSCIIPTR